MTAQMHDQFILEGKTYSIVGIKGDELFDPKRLGLTPVGTCTACWRGYVCEYGIRDERLVLETLQMSLYTIQDKKYVPEPGPEINGVWPTEPEGEYTVFNTLYQDLGLEIAFTGGMLLGEGFIRELYVHMGFHPAWKYETVFEIVFTGGKVDEIRDVSEQIDELRSRMGRKPLQPGHKANEQEIRSWIESTFRQDYDLWTGIL